jgi:hypothetical protein
VLEDAARRPDLFIWHGPLDPHRLDAWLRSRQFKVPNDLRRFWIETGGGDFFESETILGLLGEASPADDVEIVNAFHRSRGMLDEYLIFHRGTGGLTAIQRSTGLYVQLNESNYVETADYPAFESWYMDVIRSEFAHQYGL